MAGAFDLGSRRLRPLRQGRNATDTRIAGARGVFGKGSLRVLPSGFERIIGQVLSDGDETLAGQLCPSTGRRGAA